MTTVFKKKFAKIKEIAKWMAGLSLAAWMVFLILYGLWSWVGGWLIVFIIVLLWAYWVGKDAGFAKGHSEGYGYGSAKGYMEGWLERHLGQEMPEWVTSKTVRKGVILLRRHPSESFLSLDDEYEHERERDEEVRQALNGELKKQQENRPEG